MYFFAVILCLLLKMTGNKMDEKLELYFEVFDSISKGKKAFGTKELGVVMQSYGMKPSELELQDMICELDSNGTGEVEFEEFVDVMMRKVKTHEAEEELREAFKIFDVDGNGFISARDLRQAMTKLGERLSNEEVDEMIREANFDHEGEINIEEFIMMLTSNNKWKLLFTN